jgi:hypothetical protein
VLQQKEQQVQEQKEQQQGTSKISKQLLEQSFGKHWINLEVQLGRQLLLFESIDEDL